MSERPENDIEELEAMIGELEVNQEKLKDCIRNLVEIYWGKGDGDPEPPECIKTANKLLKL